MRISEFKENAAYAWGETQAEHIIDSHVLVELGGYTASAAIAAGEEPRRVWRLLCDEFEVPEAMRWGPDTRE